jgi:CheY-like chemotaxis protein
MPQDQPIEILLVEDNPDDEELTVRALQKGHVANRITVTRDGAEAIDYIMCRGKYADRDPDETPKVILLDLKLPKVDGFEVLRHVKRDPRTRMIPVVVLTSSTQDKDVVESYELGVNSYITKPVDFQQFADAVQQLGLYWLVYNHTPDPVVSDLSAEKTRAEASLPR